MFNSCKYPSHNSSNIIQGSQVDDALKDKRNKNLFQQFIITQHKSVIYWFAYLYKWEDDGRLHMRIWHHTLVYIRSYAIKWRSLKIICG